MRIGGSTGAAGEYETPVGRIRWQVEDDGLRVEVRGRSKRLRWDGITRGALTSMPRTQLPANFPRTVVPGFSSLISLQQRLATGNRYLALAQGTAPHRTFRVIVPDGDPEAGRLVDVVRAWLGERWLPEEIPFESSRKALGLKAPWWYFPLFLVFFVLFGYLVLLAMAATAGILDGRIGEIPAVAWGALGLWALLVIWLLRQYRRRRGA